MTGHVISVSGPPGSGTSTLAENLRDETGCDLVSAGDIFKQLARDHSMTVAEFSELAEETPEYDKMVDYEIERKVENGNYDTGLIVDSRIVAWKLSDQVDLKIYLKSPVSVRSQRLEDREETVDDMIKREQSEEERYMDYYDIDISDLSVYDLIIDTSTFDKASVLDISLEAYRNLKV